MNDAKLARIALIGLRWSLGTAFLSAVASRLGLLGSAGGDWQSFLKYAAQVNWYLPPKLVPVVAIATTVLESTFGCLLIVGWQVRYAAFGSAGLLAMFALAMASGEPRSPFDYSVFTAAFGALTLATTYERTK
jgi:putative oxidoreductase